MNNIHRILSSCWSRLTVAVAICLLLPLLLIHRVCFTIDELFWPRLKTKTIDKPLFVVGLPRSGTTYFHRLVATNTQTFTTLRLWELLFAPALCQKKLFRAMYRGDQLLGGLGHRVVTWLQRLISGNLEAVHATDLQSPEEDYLGLLPFDGCFLRVLLFPYSKKSWQLGNFSQALPQEEKSRLLRAYRGLLVRHLEFCGEGRRLLSKNPSFSSWIPDLAAEFPDATFVALRRNPHEVVPSQLSSIRSGLKAFGYRPEDEQIVAHFMELLANYWNVISEQQLLIPSHRFQLVEYSDFTKAPFSVVTDRLECLGYELSEHDRSLLRDACITSQSYRSKHRYSLNDFGLTPMQIDTAFHLDQVESRSQCNGNDIPTALQSR